MIAVKLNNFKIIPFTDFKITNSKNNVLMKLGTVKFVLVDAKSKEYLQEKRLKNTTEN